MSMPTKWVSGLMVLILLAGSGLKARANGRLILDDEMRPIPQVQTTPMEVKNASLIVKIEDQVATTTVDEVFHNPNNRQMEGIFMLPLPGEAAVNNLSMWINGQETKGELLDKDKAWQVYGDIVRKMQDPALLEYVGTKLLKLRIFPIPANGDTRIKFNYTYQLPNDTGLCVYRYPLATNKFSSAPLKQLLIKVDLKSTAALKTIYSPSHPNVDIIRKDDHTAVVSLEQNNVTPDKDFLLYYTVSDKDVGVNLVSYKKPGEDGYFMMMVSPKYEISYTDVVKKDIIFVVDTSGSMAGEKIEQARNALKFCINSLNEGDRFNIVTFATESRSFKDSLQEVSGPTRATALEFIKEIEARGGTNINEALEKALAMSESNRPFMIVFMTDGLPTVGEQNPEIILKNVASKNRAAVRIFTFGVGYDVNTHLLDKLAEVSRGSREYIAPQEDIEIKVSNFYNKIAYPVLAGLKLAINDIDTYHTYPGDLPDLFKGSQLVIFGRYKGEGNKLIRLSVTVNGQTRQLDYESTFAAQNTTTDFIPRMWAISRVGFLMDEIRLRAPISSGQGENKEVKDEIIKLSKEFGIMTPYTAWLVVEDTHNAPSPLSTPGIRGFTDDLKKDSESFAPMENSKIAMDSTGGEKSITMSTETKRLKEGQVDYNGKDEDHWNKTINRQIKQAGDKTFYLGANGVWYDAVYQETNKDKIVKVKYLSDEYFDLLQKHPALAKYFAVGEKAVVCFGDKIFEVVNQ
ncbi:MAG: VIT domain-containing protein [Planctomycetota bacterium]